MESAEEYNKQLKGVMEMSISKFADRYKYVDFIKSDIYRKQTPGL